MKETIDGALAVAREVAGPLYRDALQPVAQEVGKALAVVGRAVNVALAPLKALVWGGEQLEQFVQDRVAPKLSHLPPDQIITPAPTVAVPILQALTYAGSEPTLSEMYANLLATSMDASRARTAHPAFVDAIKQLTPDDAKVLTLLVKEQQPVVSLHRVRKGKNEYWVEERNFSLVGEHAGCTCPELTPTYMDNLQRLGLAEIRDDARLMAENIYRPLEEHPRMAAKRAEISREEGFEPKFKYGLVRLTTLGRQFADVCLVSGDS